MKTRYLQEPYLDCTVMKHAVQTRIAAETKGMTPHERLAHYKKLAAESRSAALIRKHARKCAAARVS